MSAPDRGELVLPFVVLIERVGPPTRTDALEAAARGVLLMLSDDRPDWQESLRAWDGQRIRKVVRRARGADWRRAAALPGITVVHGTAEVRVFPPVRVDGWPADLARLQVGGTELTDPSARLTGVAAGTPLILISPHVEMTAGKAMTQAAHAAQLGWRALDGAVRQRWRDADFALAVRTASPGEWRTAVDAGAPVVHDAGFTEVEPDAQTALIVVPRPT